MAPLQPLQDDTQSIILIFYHDTGIQTRLGDYVDRHSLCDRDAFVRRARDRRAQIPKGRPAGER